MSRDLGGGMVTDDLPTDTSQPTDKTQFPTGKVDPAAIHDLYPPVGCTCGGLREHDVRCACFVSP